MQLLARIGILIRLPYVGILSKIPKLLVNTIRYFISQLQQPAVSLTHLTSLFEMFYCESLCYVNSKEGILKALKIFSASKIFRVALQKRVS